MTYSLPMMPTTTSARRRRSGARRSSTRRSTEFADTGFHGASTEEIARAGRHLAAVRLPALRHEEGALHRVVARCFRETLETLRSGRRGQARRRRRSRRWARRTAELLAATHDRLMLMLQYAGVRRPRDPRRVVRTGCGDLVDLVEQRRGEPPEDVSRFFASGMLLNVLASMGADRRARAVGEAAARRRRRRRRRCESSLSDGALFFVSEVSDDSLHGKESR